MRLLYHNSRNIGDSINKIIFDDIVKIVAPETHIALGIGTILGLKKPSPGEVFHVFGSGISLDQMDTYGTFDFELKQQYVFHGVRGHLTAKKMGIDKSAVCGDFAYLLPDKIEKNREKLDLIGFVPHKDSLDLYFDWDELLLDVGIKLINPYCSPVDFVNQLTSCKKVVCEAMHGAIIADAYDVPWRPLFTFDGISESKWQDWLSVLSHKNVHFTKFRGPRKIDFKKEQLSRYFQEKLATCLACGYERIGESYFKFRLQNQLEKDFYLTPRTEVSKIQNRQRTIINEFIDQFA
jgi:succinoglycan biosynthesis protein ExoV